MSCPVHKPNQGQRTLPLAIYIERAAVLPPEGQSK